MDRNTNHISWNFNQQNKKKIHRTHNSSYNFQNGSNLSSMNFKTKKKETEKQIYKKKNKSPYNNKKTVTY